jgi:hypothetical protein
MEPVLLQDLLNICCIEGIRPGGLSDGFPSIFLAEQAAFSRAIPSIDGVIETFFDKNAKNRHS